MKLQPSIRTTLLLIISVLNLLITVLVGSDVYDSWVKLDHARDLTRASVTTNLLYKAEKFLSLERAASTSVLYAAPDAVKSLQDDIAADRNEAGTALKEGLARIKNSRIEEADTAALVEQVETRLADFQTLRADFDATAARPIKGRDPKISDQIFNVSTALIMKIGELTQSYVRPLQGMDATVSRQMLLKYSVWETAEYAGREYAMIGRLITEEKPVTRDVLENMLTWRALIDHGWETAQQLAGGSGLDKRLAPYISEAQGHYFQTFGQIKSMFYVPTTSGHVHYPLSAEMWFVLSSDAVDSLLALKDASLLETQEYVDQMEHDAEHEILTTAFLFFCAMAVSLYCLAIIIWRVIRPINVIVEALYQTSQGVPHAPLPYLQRNDEIGKLTAVLDVFEENLRTIKQSNEELERYAYITAHDLKSPLRAIDNLSMWIEEDLGESITGQTKEHMNLLRQRVRRMEKLLNDTLEYSRIGRKTEPGEVETVNGKTLLEDAVTMSNPPAGFKVKIDDKFSSVSLIRTPLQQVFYNLINNAIKHHDKKEGVIEISVQEEPGRYAFSVRDDGPGIPAQYHEKIFEMFQTLRPRDEREGSGMGLAIVRKILTASGGSIILESQPGHGALFRFTWPKPGMEKKNDRQKYVG